LHVLAEIELSSEDSHDEEDDNHEETEGPLEDFDDESQERRHTVVTEI